MPIPPHIAKRYPADWNLRRRFIVEYRAAGRCEWCGAVNYQPHPDTGSKVVLTVAHVWDKRPEQASLLNLSALCQRCHLNWDRREHGFNRLRNRIARLMRQGQIPLCLPREDSLAMALYDELVSRRRDFDAASASHAAGLSRRVLRMGGNAMTPLAQPVPSQR